ncbi:MAG: divalent-cation tolerance protein CutA [Candidatus Hodarchaeales archaeon]|jgi:periplasmic divalent cation tolerance protein
MMFVAVYTTFSDFEEAKMIARMLIERKFVACVNLIPNMLSVYSWKGKIEESNEIIMWCKTREELVHSYDLPAFAVYPIKSGSEPYLKWIIDST